MAISPNQQEALAVEIRRIYEDAEIQLLRMIAKKLYEGHDVADWQSVKLSQLSKLLRDARRVTGDLDKKVTKELKKMIELAYLAGNDSALGDVKAALSSIEDGEGKVPRSIQLVLFPDDPDVRIDIDATMATFSGINTAAVSALAGATTETILNTHVPIVRAVNDVYREVVTKVIGSALVGTETRREVTQRILNDFAARGIKSFTENSERRRKWNMASYSEMATRTGIGQASVAGHIDKMQEMGFDLIQVSDHAEECDLCRPWEGKVLSVGGKDARYKTLDEAINAGLFHPNCGHRANTYFEGLTEPLGKTADPAGYADRKQQRYLERTIRYWKKRQALSMSPEAQKKTNAKLSEWENAMAAFVADTGRRRKREREQNIKAR